MKTLTALFAIALAFSFSFASAQTAPEIEWQNTIGGNASDYLWSIEQTFDGGYILGGYSYSEISGDKAEGTVGNSGKADYWIVKLDSTGTIEWENTIGGKGQDYLLSVHQTPDSGFILGGYSESGNNGDKTEDGLGGKDYWIVKLNSTGSIDWQNTIGGSDADRLATIALTSDGGYILGGDSESEVSGDKTEASLGEYDYWVLKLDSAGNIEWQNTIGGNANDYFWDLKQTFEGGYILGGYSDSEISGDKTEASQGEYDYWVIKLDSVGNIEWQNSIGGNIYDFLYYVVQTNDSGYIVGGDSNSGIAGDKTEACWGGTDGWVIKLNNSGNIEWQNVIGGYSEEYMLSLCQTADGGYFLGGYSPSIISGDKTEACLGGTDYWVLKLDETGNIEWQNTIGGNNYEELHEILQTSDEGYIIAGNSYSDVYGDKTEACLGSHDYWVVKLYSCDQLITYYADGDSDGYGNSGITIEGTACNIPAGYCSDSTDCNDAESTINPVAAEICNNTDDNCNGSIDDGLSFITYYADADGDTYGDESDTISSCAPVTGYVTDNNDCDDNNASINPSVIEICNSIDDNCINGIDDGLVFVTYYADADGDNYGDANNSISACAPVPAYVTDSTDCDDTNHEVNPASLEISNNGIDDDCDGDVDEFGVGVGETDDRDFQLTVYPNPTDGNVIIEVMSTQEQPLSIKLFDVLSREVYSEEAESISGTFTRQLDLNHLPSGTYFLKVMDDGVSEMRKVVVEK